MNADPAASSWHLDKRIPIALIVALMLQASGLIVWGTRIDARLGYVETTLATRTPIVDRYLQTESDVRSLRLETSSRLDRIETKLDRLIENGSRRVP